ncbi:hypothetical protein KGQ20_43925, partial [Catenulispora sp. NF23]
AEATYVPPPVRDHAASDAGEVGVVGRSENGTPSATSMTDATPSTDVQTHNNASGNDGITSMADSDGVSASDIAAMPPTDAPTGSEPTAGIADPARPTDNKDADQASPPEPGGNDMPRRGVPAATDGTAREADSASPGQTNAGFTTNATDTAGTPGASAEGPAAAADRTGPDGVPAAEPTVQQVVSESAASDGEQAHRLDPAATTADGSLIPAAPSTPDGATSDLATPRAAVEQGTGAPESRDPDGTDAVERYRAEDLGPFVAFGTKTNHKLYEGPDGRWHAIGDEVGRGLHREGTGRLRDRNGYVTDDNKLPQKGIDAHAERGQPLDRMPVPTTADQLSNLAEVNAATLDRTEKQAAKNEIWANQVEPLVDSLEQVGLTVDRNTFAGAKFKDEFDRVERNLPRGVRAAAALAINDYAEASKNLVDASETVGVTGGRLAASLLYPGGQTITSSDGVKGVKETLDRTLYDDSGAPMLIIIEEKGAGSTLGVSKVSDPNNPGAKIVAQQCSPEYVHHLLENDATLAAALQSDPQLYRNVKVAIEGSKGGTVECLLVHTSADGAVNVAPYLLDPSRFRRETIRIPSDEGTV